ncbi:hypothetical protein PYCCODRAFT_872276 [Trametes coccinea BRFM310]|uniref:Uncharacterized protein n=1 Tax=Trametes coccinea (strain BRFM310) TaxID=1353009 RepID=A0A1Y2IFW7_TRAC3|nr:hypothetical protein PYCCODRAFT_872276 [Trametes coccinea BRFM310]
MCSVFRMSSRMATDPFFASPSDSGRLGTRSSPRHSPTAHNPPRSPDSTPPRPRNVAHTRPQTTDRALHCPHAYCFSPCSRCLPIALSLIVYICAATYLRCHRPLVLVFCSCSSTHPHLLPLGTSSVGCVGGPGVLPWDFVGVTGTGCFLICVFGQSLRIHPFQVYICHSTLRRPLILSLVWSASLVALVVPLHCIINRTRTYVFAPLHLCSRPPHGTLINKSNVYQYLPPSSRFGKRLADSARPVVLVLASLPHRSASFFISAPPTIDFSLLPLHLLPHCPHNHRHRDLGYGYGPPSPAYLICLSVSLRPGYRYVFRNSHDPRLACAHAERSTARSPRLPTHRTKNFRSPGDEDVLERVH